MPDPSDDQKADVEARKEAFLKEYEELTQKHQVSFGMSPMYVPLQNGLYGTVINSQVMDTKYLATPSPFA